MEVSEVGVTRSVGVGDAGVGMVSVSVGIGVRTGAKIGCPLTIT